jgi:L-rhamnose 1-dehydrogenase
MIDLTGRSACVTGGARGIGRAIAEGYAREGARVCIADIDGMQSEETATAIGANAFGIRLDVTRMDSIKSLVTEVEAKAGGIDILVNNAAICPFVGFLEMPEPVWQQVLDVNLTGYFLCSQAVARVMVEQGVRGRIIAVSSISAEFGGSQQAHYCASKAGINLLIKSMAISLGPFGITCNAVLPGTVETDINRDSLADPAVRNYWSQRAPLGRIGQPEDVAGPVLFFASDDSAWCTGSMLVVDGGTSVNLQ